MSSVNNNIPLVPENTIDPAAGLNESINVIDALLQVAVVSVGANTPPGSPAVGARYIVGTAPTGAWSGQANKLARWLDGVWSFFDARYAVSLSDNKQYIRGASGWSAIDSSGITSRLTQWATSGGTANAITLTSVSPRSTYQGGDLWRCRISTTNTGAATINIDGLGAKTAVTVTGAALPAGYIRTDIDTTITYDAVADRFVVGRETEYGSSLTGSFKREACGSIEVWNNAAVSHSCDQASGVFFRSPNADIWALPAEVLTSQPYAFSPNPASAVRWAGGQLTTSSTASIRSYQATSGATVIDVNAKVTGRWY